MLLRVLRQKAMRMLRACLLKKKKNPNSYLYKLHICLTAYVFAKSMKCFMHFWYHKRNGRDASKPSFSVKWANYSRQLTVLLKLAAHVRH